jgi:hypothetical protein
MFSPDVAPDDGNAIVSQSKLSRLPIVSAGTVTAPMLRKALNLLEDYCSDNDIKDDAVFKRLGKMFRHNAALEKYHQMAEARWTDKDRIPPYTLQSAWKELTEHHIPPSYHENRRAELYGLRQRANETAEKFFFRASTIVNDLPEEMRPGNEVLISLCTAALRPALRDKIATLSMSKEGHRWVADVSKQDQLLRKEEKNLKVNDKIAAPRRPTGHPLSSSSFANLPLSQLYQRSSSAHRQQSSSSTISQQNKHGRPLGGWPPQITDREHPLFDQYHGCTNCRQFYAGHLSYECPNPAPDGSTYRERTERDALEAQRKWQHSTSAVIFAVHNSRRRVGACRSGPGPRCRSASPRRHSASPHRASDASSVVDVLLSKEEDDHSVVDIDDNVH